MNILSTQYGPMWDSRGISKILLVVSHSLASTASWARVCLFNHLHDPMTKRQTIPILQTHRSVTCSRSLNFKEADPGF